MHQSRRRCTVEEYFDLQQGTEIRLEYYDGEIYAMSGGTRDHERIALNVAAFFHTALRGSRCEAFGSNMWVTTPSGLYTYPDVSVVCGSPELTGRDERTTLLNPVVLVEVLSDSTRDYDRGDKFDLYRSIASLRDVLLIEQTRISVEHRKRGSSGEWTTHVEDSSTGTVRLSGVDLELPLASVYERVELPR